MIAKHGMCDLASLVFAAIYLGAVQMHPCDPAPARAGSLAGHLINVAAPNHIGTPRLVCSLHFVPGRALAPLAKPAPGR
jgi:hypothetical protein